MFRRLSVALLSVLAISCGGGGGSDAGGVTDAGSTGNGAASTPSDLSGNVAALVSPPSAPPIQHTARLDMLIQPGAPVSSFPSVSQVAVYDLDAGAEIKVATLVMNAPDTSNGFFMPFVDATAFPGDASLAKPTGMQFLLPGDGATAPTGIATESSETLGGLPGLTFENSPPGSVPQALAYVIPFSAAINPEGYTYQTIGSFLVVPGQVREGYFSTGVPTLTVLPSSGTASYTGKLAASTVYAQQRDPGEADGTVTATIDFAAQTVTIATTAMTNLSNNAPTGATPAAAPELSFNGVLTFAAGSNTFSGAVTATNGMTGNVTGRFYGAGIGATTATKAVGSPPEIGGTFALFASGGTALLGAFGGK